MKAVRVESTTISRPSRSVHLFGSSHQHHVYVDLLSSLSSSHFLNAFNSGAVGPSPTQPPQHQQSGFVYEQVGPSARCPSESVRHGTAGVNYQVPP
jgi:hypothetical protein